MSAIKISVRPPQNEWSVSFQQAEIYVGRGGDTPLDITLPDPTVSRCHGRIWLSPDGYWFEDNNSTHGSKKNGDFLMGPVRIFSGDRLTMGQSELVIEQADITSSDFDLNELFDVHVQDRLHLHQTPASEQSVSAKIKVIGQKAYQAEEKRSEEKTPADLFGGLVNIFGYEGLNDALFLSIEDIVHEFNAVERGCVLLLDTNETELVVASHYPLFEPAVSATLARKTMEDQCAFIWQAEESSFSSASIKKLNIKTGMYAPMTFGAKNLGIISIDTTSSQAEFTRNDLDLFVNITRVLSSLVYTKQMEEA